MKVGQIVKSKQDIGAAPVNTEFTVTSYGMDMYLEEYLYAVKSVEKHGKYAPIKNEKGGYEMKDSEDGKPSTIGFFEAFPDEKSMQEGFLEVFELVEK